MVGLEKLPYPAKPLWPPLQMLLNFPDPANLSGPIYNSGTTGLPAFTGPGSLIEVSQDAGRGGQVGGVGNSMGVGGLVGWEGGSLPPLGPGTIFNPLPLPPPD